MMDSSNDYLLPPDIRSLSVSLRQLTLNRFRNDRYIAAWIPAGLNVVSIQRENNVLKSITVSRATTDEEDTVSLSSLIAMQAQKPHQITVKLAETPTAEQLMAAGNNYPADITDRYLQLPADFPSQVSDLASSLTSNLNNAYAKALTIQYYLSKIPYSLDIQAPPPGADGVQYFLFTQKSGYCVYFASAMAVMLRSEGIPARMVVGFAPGQYDQEEQRFLIRDRDYHAWTEVYFPGYGWVTFDPTPSSGPDLAAGSSSGANSSDPFDPYYYLDPGYYQPPVTGGTAPAPQRESYAGYIAASVTAFILLIIFLAWFFVYRRPDSNSSLYPRMVVLASVAGLRPRSTQTPLEFAGQLSAALPEHALDIASITSVYMDVRYGKRPLDAAHRRDLTDAWNKIRGTLIKRLFHVK
jgi:transglutaminase-like putative cysteine protease